MNIVPWLSLFLRINWIVIAAAWHRLAQWIRGWRHGIGLVAMLGLSLGAGCQRAKEPDDAPVAQVKTDTVTFPAGSPQVAAIPTQPAEAAQAGRLRLTGRLVWDEDATVRLFTAFEGRVTRILAPVGARVEKGAPLALIASPDFGQVQADAAKAALDLRLAEQTMNRVQELAANGAAAEKDRRAAEIELARARGEAQRTARRLELYSGGAEATDHEFALRSPLPGVVVEKAINPGQGVRPDQITANAPPLFVVTDPTRLWVLLDATEQDLPLLKPGAAVALHTATYPDASFEARVQTIADAIDPNSRTIKVRATVDNTERRLKAEMFVTAELPMPRPDGVEVPSAAVFLKGDRHYVFVERARGSFQRREVQIGAEREGRLLVTGGLRAGENVVCDGGPVLDQIIVENGTS